MIEMNIALGLNKQTYLAPISKTLVVKPEKSFLQEYEDSGTGVIDPTNPGDTGGTAFP